MIRAVLLLPVMLVPLAKPEVYVWEGTLTLPIYEEGGPIQIRHTIFSQLPASIIHTFVTLGDKQAGGSLPRIECCWEVGTPFEPAGQGVARRLVVSLPSCR
jgi:hypothetical protein